MMATAIKQPRMSAEEKKWRAESDAQSLARAQEIMCDKKRHAAAKAHASKEAAKYTAIAKKGRK
jgi:hypothetical protein